MAGPESATSPAAAVIRQDARMYGTVIGAGDTIEHRLGPGRHAWIQCATGRAVVNGIALQAGDGLAASAEPLISLAGADPESELLLFDLA
jgi:hypothetical protein